MNTLEAAVSSTEETYIKPIKVMIVKEDADERGSFGVLTDATYAAHYISYKAEEDQLKEGSSYILIGATVRSKQVQIKSGTRIFKTSDLPVSDHQAAEAKALIDAPRYPITEIRELLAQDTTSTNICSVKGQIVTLQEPRSLTIKAQPTKVREIAIDDGSAKITADLWNASAELEFNTGETVLFRDCLRKYSPFKKSNTISINRTSQVIKTSSEQVVEVIIEGYTTFNQKNEIEIITSREGEVNILNIPKDLLVKALGVGTEWSEASAQLALPKTVNLTVKSNTVVQINERAVDSVVN